MQPPKTLPPPGLFVRLERCEGSTAVAPIELNVLKLNRYSWLKLFHFLLTQQIPQELEAIIDFSRCKACGRRSSHPFWRMHFCCVLFCFVKGKKRESFKALWREPNTTHDLSFLKLLSLFHFNEARLTACRGVRWLELLPLVYFLSFLSSSFVVNFSGTIDRITNKNIFWLGFNLLLFAQWYFRNTLTFLLFIIIQTRVQLRSQCIQGEENKVGDWFHCSAAKQWAQRQRSWKTLGGRKKSIPGQRSARFVLPANHKLKLN